MTRLHGLKAKPVCFLALLLVSGQASAQLPRSKLNGEPTEAGSAEHRITVQTDVGQFPATGLWLPDGGLSVNCLPAGYSNSATCGSIIMNAPYSRRPAPNKAERGMASVSPYMDDLKARALEPSHDQVDLYLEASSQALGTPAVPNPGFAAFGVVFDRAAWVFGLPSGKHGFAMPDGHNVDHHNLDLLRKGMWVRTNNDPPLVGQLTTWDSGGRWFEVDSWTGQNGSANLLDVEDASGVPIAGRGSSEVIVDYTSAVWTMNANVFCYEFGLANSCIGLEGTINNDKPFEYKKYDPFNSTPRAWGDFWGGFRSQSFSKPGDSGPVTGADFVALGRVADGFLAFGGYNSGYNCVPDAPSAGIVAAPGFDARHAACYKAVIESGIFAQVESRQRGVTFGITADPGVMDLGAEGPQVGPESFGPWSSNPEIRFHTAGGGPIAQARIASSGGVAGIPDTGILSYRAARHDFVTTTSGTGVTVQASPLTGGATITSLGAGEGDVPIALAAKGRAATTIGSPTSPAHLVPVTVDQLGTCAVGDMRFVADAQRPGQPPGKGLGVLAICARSTSDESSTRWYAASLTPLGLN